jgi:hypothetical protein
MADIQCQNCGALWPDTTPMMQRFASTGHPPGSMDTDSDWLSPYIIWISGEQMTHCPKCPDERLDAAMYRGDDRYTAGDEDDTPRDYPRGI